MHKNEVFELFNSEGFDVLVKAHGKKKSHLALSIGKKSAIFNDWKAGKSEPKREYLEILAEELQTTPEFLAGESDDPFGILASKRKFNSAEDKKEKADSPKGTDFKPTEKDWERAIENMSKEQMRVVMDMLMKKYVEE